jgi:hypothetical protein
MLFRTEPEPFYGQATEERGVEIDDRFGVTTALVFLGFPPLALDFDPPIVALSFELQLSHDTASNSAYLELPWFERRLELVAKLLTDWLRIVNRALRFDD